MFLGWSDLNSGCLRCLCVVKVEGALTGPCFYNLIGDGWNSLVDSLTKMGTLVSLSVLNGNPWERATTMPILSIQLNGIF